MGRNALNRKVYGGMVREMIAAVGCSFMSGSNMSGENHRGNLLWQSCRTFYPSKGGDGVLETLE